MNQLHSCCHVFSHAEITPGEIQVADSAEFVIRLVIGPDYTNGESRLCVDFMAMLGTSIPSIWLNEDSGYVDVYVTNPRVTYRKNIWDFKNQRLISRANPPHREASRMLVLDFSAGLREGDVIEIHWGETTRGFGPGAKVTSCVPRLVQDCAIPIRYFSDPEKALPDEGRSFKGYERPVPDDEAVVSYRVVPRAPARLRVIRQTHRTLLIPHDAYWNVAHVAEADALVQTDAAGTRNAQGVFEYADSHVRIVSKGLPLIDHAPMDGVLGDLNLYWGDIHSHSAISIDCVTNSRMDMTPADHMQFARDRAGLDFYAVTDHHVPAGGERNKLQPGEWESIVSAAEKYHEPGRFVPFPAFELSNPRGDVVFVLKDPLGYEHINQDWKDVRDAWRTLRGQDYMSIPHFHGPGSLPEGTWWENPDQECEPVIELISDHGSYEREEVVEQGRAASKIFRFDRCGKFFLQNGYRYGFVGNGDDHKGHVGVNGLTAVFARELTREAIFDAYRKRHVYATSNARIRLLFTGNKQLMGSVVPNALSKQFFIQVHGEGALKRIDLFKNGELHQMLEPSGLNFSAVVEVEDAAPSNWYVRVTQQDNQVAISSPIWFE